MNFQYHYKYENLREGNQTLKFIVYLLYFSQISIRAGQSRSVYLCLSGKENGIQSAFVAVCRRPRRCCSFICWWHSLVCLEEHDPTLVVACPNSVSTTHRILLGWPRHMCLTSPHDQTPFGLPPFDSLEPSEHVCALGSSFCYCLVCDIKGSSQFLSPLSFGLHPLSQTLPPPLFVVFIVGTGCVM